ncbi:MAG: histidinol-phosphate transaminase [Bacteroidetes bacterium]|nr:histidinol-phosphate transaminase [Bacteroidota bacterium]
MNNYWSQLTKTLSPYEPGEQPQDRKYLKLNTNENPFPPSEMVLSKIKGSVCDSLRLYPDPNATKLKSSIANYYNLDIDNIFVGNGSDEILAFSFLAFFKDKNAISFPSVTYSFYPVYCNLYEIEFNTFPLDSNFSIDIDKIDTNSGGIIFPNPNAPTGVYLGLSEIETMLTKFPNIVVVVDEAYIDFGGVSCIKLVKKYHNLLVIQTFSKSRSLAGLRVGFSIGHPNLIQALNRVKNSFNSYPLDSIAIEGGIAAIEDVDHFTYCCNQIIESRQFLENELNLMSFQVLPSKANFLFVRHAKLDGALIYSKLRDNGILVRHFNDPNIDNFLRITIGKKEDMILLVKSIKSILEVDHV